MWKSPRLSDVSEVRSEPESQTFFPPASSFDPERAGGTVAAESAAPPPPLGTAGTVAAETPSPAPSPESTDGTVATESAAVESASAEIEFVTSAIEDLQSRLERANTQMNQVTAVRATEREIGLLFVEAQKFTEAALAKLEGQIHQILDQAEAKAAQIVREAQEEAEEVRRQAESASVFPAEKAQELQAAIRGFSSINGELVKELSALNTMLSPPSERGIHAAPSTNGTGSPS
jgi:hypothetical protein